MLAVLPRPMNRHRLNRSAALGLALAAIAAPTASVQQDLRNPDTRDAARAVSSTKLSPAAGSSWGRSDARDAAQPRRDTGSAFTPPLTGPPTWPMDPEPIASAPPAKVADGGNGVDWTTIGPSVAGSVLAISGIAALYSRRSHRRRRLREHRHAAARATT